MCSSDLSFCAEKSTFGKYPNFYWKRHNSPGDPRNRKGGRGGCTRQPHPSWARPGVGPHPTRVWPPRAPPRRSPLDYIRPLTYYLTGDSSYYAKHIYAPPPTRSRFRGSEVPFWHPAGTGIRRRSSPSSSSPPLHRPSMISPSMCE